MKKARRVLAEKRNACPTVSIPTIPAEHLTEIAQLINMPKRNQFVQRLLGYWTLKRESRNGVPLLRRLQVSHATSRHKALTKNDNSEEHNNEQTIQLKGELKEMYRLRQDLERARILVELIRKREKVKREVIRNLEQPIIFQLNPFNTLLDSILNLLKAKGTHGFFFEPVDTNEVHDYLQFIKTPMSFKNMKDKIDHFEYTNFDEFENDFNLLVDNCTTYNQKTTIYFKSAVKMKEQCKAIFKQAKSLISEIGFDEKKGVHYAPTGYTEIPMKVDQPSRSFIQFAKDGYKKQLETRMNKLRRDLETTNMKKSGGTKSKRLKTLNDELEKVKKELFGIDGFNSFNDMYQSSSDATSFNGTAFLKKSPRGRPSKSSKKQNGNKTDAPVYSVFNFKNSKAAANHKSTSNNSFDSVTTNSNSSSNKRKNDGINKTPKNNKKSISNELSMKPITSYYQVLQNSNSDSFKVYRARSKSDSSDSPTSDRDSSDSTSSSSSSSLNNNLNDDSSNDSFEEEPSRKKMKKISSSS